MMINNLYEEYFQKSRVFLYPALNIKRGGSVTAIETHICWENKYKKEDRKLICLYYLRTDAEFVAFEKAKLLDNPLFENYWQIEDTEPKGVYVFNFDGYKEDWDNFLKGKYSLFSKDLKNKIINYFSKNNVNAVYIDSYLNPKKYFEIYSKLLGVPVNVLKEVGELCSLPDLEKEKLIADIKNLEMKNFLL